MASNGKPVVYANYKINDNVAEILSESCDVRISSSDYPTLAEILEDVAGVQVIYCVRWLRITEEILDAAGSSLKAVFTPSAGYDHIDLKACKKRNIRVGYFGNLMAKCTAEYTLGLMLATGRRFKEAIAVINRGEWVNRRSFSFLSGFRLIDSTVGIVGLGSIGLELAKLLKAFNVRKILYSCPRKKQEGEELGAEYAEFDELLRHSDFVVVCCTSNDQTKGLFNRRSFDLMKSTAIFVNISRGEIVDQNALHDALVERRIFASGLDVSTPEPLLSLDNCTVLPHMATLTFALQKQLAHVTVGNIVSAINGEPMPCELYI